MRLKKPMTVGEMIAAHHANDAFFRARQNIEAFRKTEIGAAFLRFEQSLGEAWRLDTELGFRDIGDKAAKRAWERSDQDRMTFLTFLDRLMRKTT